MFPPGKTPTWPRGARSTRPRPQPGGATARTPLPRFLLFFFGQGQHVGSAGLIGLTTETRTRGLLPPLCPGLCGAVGTDDTLVYQVRNSSRAAKIFQGRETVWGRNGLVGLRHPRARPEADKPEARGRPAPAAATRQRSRRRVPEETADLGRERWCTDSPLLRASDHCRQSRRCGTIWCHHCRSPPPLSKSRHLPKKSPWVP